MIKKIKNPLVSIIINCFNGDRYLAKAIDSVFKQTYKNWEIIFWDVSNNQKSKNIIKKFKDKRLKYYWSPKNKLYYSRNDAVKKSKGNYIAFLDCDDWWSPEKLEKQIKYFTDKSVGLVYANYYIFNQKTNSINKINSSKIYSGYIQEKLLKDYQIGILTTIIRKKYFEKLKGFKNLFHIVGDFEFNVRLSNTYKIVGIKQPLAYYRVHNKNISKNLNLELKELKNCYKSFLNEGISKKNLDFFNNYITYKKFYCYIYNYKKFSAFRIFFDLKNNYLKLKALIMLLSPINLLRIR